LEIISRKEAKSLGLIHYFTGKPCKHGHTDKRYVDNGHCLSCCNDQNKKRLAYKAANRRKNREENRNNQKEKASKHNKAWMQKNKERRARYAKERYERNKDSFRKSARERAKESYPIYKQRYIAHAAARRARKMCATPPWLSDEDKSNISAVYEMSFRLSNCLGIKHHVDHIVPLKGKNVCGLHVPWNLAAIPASLNLSKGSNFNSAALDIAKEGFNHDG